MARHDRNGETLSVVQLLPSLITIVGLCAGLSSMRYVLAERYEVAALLIVFAAIVDGLDGMTARRFGATTTIGAELDTLSDFVSFGVAPALLVFHHSLAGLHGIGWAVALGYAICCCLRLARFNVSRLGPADAARASHFVGVPAPAGALLALLPVFLAFSGLVPAGAATAAFLALVGLLMVSTLPTLSPRSVRVRKDQVVWILAGTAVLVGLLLSRPWLLLVAADIGYLAILAVTTVRRWRRRGKETPWTPPR